MNPLRALCVWAAIVLSIVGCGSADDGTAATESVHLTGAKTYTTNFPLTEYPISEGGNWVNGATTGLDWGDVSTTPGQTHDHSGPARYADATALLTGTWAPDQMAQATVYAGSTSTYPEVELRLRSSLTPHRCTGYEIAFSLAPNGYMLIVRWNGPLGDWTILAWPTGDQYRVTTGDVVKATIAGNVITAYKNGVQMAQVTDTTYATGNPGMGFNELNNGTYGYSSFTASELGAPPPPPPGNGTGLTGTYFDNIDLTNQKLVRTDATVNFSWGNGSPNSSIGPDSFSVRWTGKVQPLYSGTYTFYTTTDDGVRLWINGALIIDKWQDQGPTEYAGTISLVAGTQYDIKMEYYENGGGANAALAWSSAGQAKQVIPQSQLYSGSATCSPESDAAFCSRLGATCGSKTANDNCGLSRSVSSCGTCSGSATCSANACVGGSGQTALFRINAGGGAFSPFGADGFYAGGSTYGTGSSISTAGVSNPAPASVYQTERYGNATYTFTGLTALASHTVRLHFAEIFQSSAGSRLFNVAINGTTVLSSFDIFAAAGGANKAIVKEFTVAADSNGKIAIAFATVRDNAKISGIEILKP
ncbi:MAG TPA: PA14 domain-containing protein [Polyangiaceae bacterium]|nr:PA14 domain-containing protein [Polyangiaceae bacterium]